MNKLIIIYYFDLYMCEIDTYKKYRNQVYGRALQLFTIFFYNFCIMPINLKIYKSKYKNPLKFNLLYSSFKRALQKLFLSCF